MKKRFLFAAVLMMITNLSVSASENADELIVENDSAMIEMIASEETEPAVVLDTLKLNNGKIFISGSADGESRVTVKIIKRGTQGKFIKDVYDMMEIRQKDNRFEYELVLPDERSGIATEGIFDLYINGINVTPDGIDVISKKEREAFINSLEEIEEADELKALLFSEDTDVILANFGLGGDEMGEMDEESEKNQFIEIFMETNKDFDIQPDNLFDVINSSKKILDINNTTVTEDALEEIGLSFEGTMFSDITDDTVKKAVTDGIEANKPYLGLKQIESAYEEINILYLLNNAKYQEYDELIEKYDEKISAKDESWWEEYASMTETKKTNVKKDIKRALGDSPAKSFDDFCGAFADVIDEYTSQSGSGSSGGSSSGSGGSGSKSGSSIVSVGGNQNQVTGGITAPGDENDFPTFTDLSDAEWAKGAILELAGQGIINGYEDGSFKPNSFIKREEFVTLAVKAFKISEKGEACDFADVEADKWYYPYIVTCFNNGFISGISEEEFGVGKNITRQDAAVIVNRILNLTVKQADEFEDDDKIAEYAKTSVYTLKNKKIISGTEDNFFNPANNLTRAECVIILKNAIEAK